MQPLTVGQQLWRCVCVLQLGCSSEGLRCPSRCCYRLVAAAAACDAATAATCLLSLTVNRLFTAHRRVRERERDREPLHPHAATAATLCLPGYALLCLHTASACVHSLAAAAASPAAAAAALAAAATHARCCWRGGCRPRALAGRGVCACYCWPPPLLQLLTAVLQLLLCCGIVVF